MGVLEGEDYVSDYTGNEIDQYLSVVAAGVAPTSHASTDTTYGKATAGKYGHVMLSSAVDGTSGVNGGTAATPAAVRLAYNKADGKPDLTSSTTPIMDGTAAVGDSTEAARANHVHPSDTSKLSLSGGTMTGAIAMGSNKITGLGTPTADGDAATKKYVDDNAGGGGTDITNLAPAFSTSTAYKKGQYVTYSGQLYRFTENHSAGAWNASHVTADYAAGCYVNAGQTANNEMGTRATAEGQNCKASGSYAHAEGASCTASGTRSHAQNNGCTANHADQFAFGSYNKVDPSSNSATTHGDWVEIVGNGTSSARKNARTLDWDGNEQLAGQLYVGADTSDNVLDESKKVVTQAELAPAFDTATAYGVGDYVTYSGNVYQCIIAHSAGAWNGDHFYQVTAVGQYVTAGKSSGASVGPQATAEGYLTEPSGAAAHAEGYGTMAYGDHSHSEGHSTRASGEDAHAEGNTTVASGANSHAEGAQGSASGMCSHSEGRFNVADGRYSHVEGYNSYASHQSQHVFGEYNELDTSESAATAHGNYVEIVGNGDSSARSNARTLDWYGNQWLAGKLQALSNSNYLVNWNFLYPVNQLGVSINTAVSATDPATYNFLDCWKLTSGTATLTSTGVTLNGTMAQTIERAPSGTVTASVLCSSGEATATYSSGTFTLTSSGGTIVAVKLEDGGVQTLYRDTTLLDPAPNPTTELLKCQRYMYVMSGALNTGLRILGLGLATSATTIVLPVQMPVPMVSTPTLTTSGLTGTNLFARDDYGVTNIQLSSPTIKSFFATAQQVSIEFTTSGTLTAGKMYPIVLQSGALILTAS